MTVKDFKDLLGNLPDDMAIFTEGNGVCDLMIDSVKDHFIIRELRIGDLRTGDMVTEEELQQVGNTVLIVQVMD